MSLTLFGAIILVIGLYLLVRASLVAMLAFVMIVTLFGGSAALSLPALGGSTIPPASLALVFLMLRAILPGTGGSVGLGTAVAENAYLLIFGLYGSITAWLLPRLFNSAVKVTPLRPGAVRQLYEDVPVHFTSQNVTTSFYMLGTLAAGFGSYVAAVRPGSVRTIATVGIGIAYAHALLGFLSIAVANTPLEIIIKFFRNGRYAQLDQSIYGLSRMAGVWPEASGFAAFGGAWLIFMTELWLRNIRPTASGCAALLLAIALLISTSSTAYVTLGGYSVILIARALLIPTSISGRKLFALGVILLVGAIIALTMMLAVPSIAESFVKIIRIMTVNKSQSWSGEQRLFWALQGLSAFTASYGLGIGAGSFRSSSLVTAIIGSMGVIGVVSFVGHLLRAFKPWNRSTWTGGSDSDAEAVGIAAAWAAGLMLMPAAIASPSPDPGVNWALFTGIAIGLRSTSRVRHRSSAPMRAPTAPGGIVMHGASI